MFVDFAKIMVESGAGGNGCISFRREKFVPKGGPNGGDGGSGGSVIIKVDAGLKTLVDFQMQKHYKARRGEHGKGSNKTGKSGESVLLKVPMGTIIKDENTGEILADLVHPDQEYIVAKGGMGGKGNQHFATAQKKAPRYAQEGTPGEKRKIILELKLLAEVGFVGLPNAGKSTLLSRLTTSKPKIADYPFTTKIPNLGIVRLDYSRSYVIADIPGIIEGAHEGKGLGLQFLRHIERTKVLVYVIDAAEDTIAETYTTLKNELADYNPELASRPSLIVLNKKDIWEDESMFSIPPSDLGHPFIGISALKDSNLLPLKHKIWELLERVDS